MGDGEGSIADVDWRVVRVGATITSERVRVIAADGSRLGVVETSQALQMASSAGLDLVEVNPRANPPVCKIMDFRKLLDAFVETARRS
jgi:translation initiation factor IF-3